jgi:hypothetical protein
MILEVILWAIDTDWGRERVAKAKDFVRKKLNLPGAFDGGRTARATGGQLGSDSREALLASQCDNRIGAHSPQPLITRDFSVR